MFYTCRNVYFSLVQPSVAKDAFLNELGFQLKRLDKLDARPWTFLLGAWGMLLRLHSINAFMAYAVHVSRQGPVPVTQGGWHISNVP